MADAGMDGPGDADMGGAAQQGGGANSPPMCSMLEFTQQMMADAEDQKDLVPIVARLIAKLVEENDKVSCTFRNPPRVLGDHWAQPQQHPSLPCHLSAASDRTRGPLLLCTASDQTISGHILWSSDTKVYEP